jgi:hypothetical protein
MMEITSLAIAGGLRKKSKIATQGEINMLNTMEKKQTIKQWAEEYDVAPCRISERLRRGWTVERALNTWCPQGYKEGRRRHNEAAKSLWVSKGKEWQKKSRDRALVARENGTTT